MKVNCTPLVAAAVVMVFGFHASAAHGFGEPKHSKVEVSAVPGTDGLDLSFKVVPNTDMQVTFDAAPWVLDISKAEGFALAAKQFDKKDLKEDLPGFVVQAKPPGAEADLSYKLTAFICTKDKTRCYREVHKGDFAWKK